MEVSAAHHFAVLEHKRVVGGRDEFAGGDLDGVAERIAGRPGWDAAPAVRRGMIREIKAPLILAPGPAALTEGLAAVRAGVVEARAAMAAEG